MRGRDVTSRREANVRFAGSPFLKIVAAAATAVAVIPMISSCGASAGLGVEDGTYTAIVPSEAQFAEDSGQGIPGGFAVLADSGVTRVEVVVDGDTVQFVIDDAATGRSIVEREVVERFSVRDREGSGPFKGTKDVIALGDESLELGGLVIDQPVLWPGSFESSPVVTLKERLDSDSGPAVSCGPAEACLLLTRAADPTGFFEATVEPGRLGPVESIEVGVEQIEVNLVSGEQVVVDRADEQLIDACGIAETILWEVPGSAGLEFDQPVLVYTVCPFDPGTAVQLVILERAAIPVLAAIPADGGEGTAAAEWCNQSDSCLWFVPTS